MHSRFITSAVVGLVIIGLSTALTAQDNDSGDKLLQVLQHQDKASPIEKRETEPEDADHGVVKRDIHNRLITGNMGPRRPEFRSWTDQSVTGKKLSDKREGFHSWGGKRSVDESEMVEAARFQNAPDDDSDRGDLGVVKRDVHGHTFTDNTGFRRPGFRSWTDQRGKLSDKREGFHSWGGKRSVDESEMVEAARLLNTPDDDSEPGVVKRDVHGRTITDDMDFKSRPGFRSWGGKRTVYNKLGDKRDGFHSWGGKRSGDDPGVDLLEVARYLSFLNGESDDDGGSEKWKKDKFRSWGGKRIDSGTMGKREMEMLLPYEQTNSEEDDHMEKRGEFRSWGGKRNDSPLDDLLRFGGKSGWRGLVGDNADGLTQLQAIIRLNYLKSALQKIMTKDLRVGKKNDQQDKQFNPWKGKR